MPPTLPVRSGIGFAVVRDGLVPMQMALLTRLTAPLALAVILALSGRPGTSAAQDANLVEFEVIARQFEFAPSRLEVPQGAKVRIQVRSEDRTHGFSIRKLRIDKIVPASGKGVTIEFEAKEAGTFEILCSESCGDGHKDMKGSLVVVARETETP
jgi:heme/copper-type cytochrome/quinol oxidase subunit 2